MDPLEFFGPHPLLIGNVLSLVLSHLPDQDVESCKEVCPLWKDECTLALKKRHSVTLEDQEDVQSLLSQVSSGHAGFTVTELSVNDPLFRLDDPLFLSLLRKVAGQLSTFNLLSAWGEKEDSDTVLRVLWEHGTLLTSMDLDVVKQTSPYLREYAKFFPVRDEISGELLVFPNLRRLDIMNYCSYPTFEDQSSLLSTICRTFPNLEQLDMFSMPKEKPSNFDNIRMPSLRSIYLVMANANIPDHNIHGLGPVQVKCLVNLKLKLEAFHLYGLNPKCENLKDFLATQADSLIDLLLVQRRPYDRSDPLNPLLSDEIVPTPFPIHLPNLLQLHVSRSFVRNLKHVFQSVPNALCVYFDFHRGCADWALAIPGSGQVPDVSVPATLKCLGINWIDPATLTRLAPSFRNITKLELFECNDALMRVIFTEMGGSLESLTLSELSVAGEMTDSGFSGLSPSGLRTLPTMSTKTSKKARNKIIQRVDAKRKNPSIADLTKLQVLCIRFVKPCAIKFFTFWPFWKLKELQFVMLAGMKVNCGMTGFMNQVCDFKCIGPLKSRDFISKVKTRIRKEEKYFVFVKTKRVFDNDWEKFVVS